MLLGGFFIANGVKAARDPEPFVAAAQPLADKLVPLAERVVPAEVADYVPRDTATLVRLNGVASALGGLGMATGIATRGGGTLAAVSMVPHVLAGRHSDLDRAAARSLTLRNVALLGAALVVSQDTRGRPSLTWRARDTRRRIAQQANRAVRSAARDAAPGVQLTGRALRAARRQATKQAKRAHRRGESALA